MLSALEDIEADIDYIEYATGPTSIHVAGLSSARNRIQEAQDDLKEQIDAAQMESDEAKWAAGEHVESPDQTKLEFARD